MVPGDVRTASLTTGFGQLDGAAPSAAVDRASTALLMYTAGSTGRPKGVLVSHDALLWAMRGFFDAPAASWLTAVVGAPLFHMNGLLTCLYVFAQGGTVCLLDRFEPHRYLRAADRQRATALVGVPTMFAMMLDAIAEEPGLDLTSVRGISCGSA